MNEDCPHCNHAWATRNRKCGELLRCQTCGCMWQERKPEPEQEPEPGLEDHIVSTIWAELERQADADPFGPCVDSSDGLIDGYVDMRAVADVLKRALWLDPCDQGCMSVFAGCPVHDAEPR